MPVPDRFGNGAARGDEDPLAELREIFDSLRARLGGGGGQGGSGGKGTSLSPWPFLAIGIALWLATGIFIIGPDERGIVLRFGRVVREVGPGPSYHLPWPIEAVLKPSVTQIRKEEFGFRTVEVGPPARYQPVDAEALMLTGDENIVKLEFIVQYRVKPEPEAASEFLFNLRDPRTTLRVVSEAAMRQVVGSNNIDAALTDERERIQSEAQKVLQATLDGYGSGIQIEAVQLQDVSPPDQVSDAFKDVISAQQDKERMINEAWGYANDVVPVARGRAAQLVNEADGYQQSQIERATGAAARFAALHEEYAKAPDVTRTRLYLETMEEILPRVDKVLIDESAGDVVPYLPLDRPARATADASAPSAASGQAP
ncbi:MAG: FtsH protease activity modulator HflK [Deltaproteobacteria bacterium]|nr:FtsH protease activity modulator HflK [Deltaproteobacteria bacterium]